MSLVRSFLLISIDFFFFLPPLSRRVRMQQCDERTRGQPTAAEGEEADAADERVEGAERRGADGNESRERSYEQDSGRTLLCCLLRRTRREKRGSRIGRIIHARSPMLRHSITRRQLIDRDCPHALPLCSARCCCVDVSLCVCASADERRVDSSFHSR